MIENNDISSLESFIYTSLKDQIINLDLSPLLHMPNVIATPHSAWYTEESIKALQRSVGEEVVRVLGGNPPLHPCNIAALKKYGF